MNLEELKKDETVLTTVRQVANDNYQIEIVEFLVNSAQPQNVAASLMKGHVAFNNTNKPRRAWQTATAEGLKEVFKIDVDTLTFEENERGFMTAEVNMMNPTLEGVRLHIRMVDTLAPQFVGHNPKQTVNKDGEVLYFVKDGNHIYSTSQVVAGEPKHAFILSDMRVPEDQVNTVANAETKEETVLSA